MGLSELTTDPVSSADWVIWACCPRFRVNWNGVLAGLEGIPPPPWTAATGVMVIVVSSSMAMKFMEGPPMSSR